MGFTENLFQYLTSMSGFTAYAVVFLVLFVCGFGVPIPEDITIISAGILVGLGKMTLEGAFLVCLIGVMVGDSIIFFLGRKYGQKVFEHRMISKVATPKRLAITEKWITEHSRFICFIARFLPGFRTIIFATAGSMKIRPVIFWTQDGLAALISIPIWLYFGKIFGKNLELLQEKATEVHNYLIVGAVSLVALYFWWKKRSAKANS